MKLQFKHQTFQSDAVKSVTDLFRGNRMLTSSFALPAGDGHLTFNDFGYGNQMLLDDEALQIF